MFWAFALAAILQAADPAPVAPVAPDRATAARLADLVNAYRASRGLEPVPYSPWLTAVAEAHAVDMARGDGGGITPDLGRDENGTPCNLHSWSARGRWTPVCYTHGPTHGRFMWSKPREISGGAYPGNGFEIAHFDPRGVAAETALRNWQSSPPHEAVIVETGIWEGYRWQAMGVGVAGRYAFIWFGRERDGHQ